MEYLQPGDDDDPLDKVCNPHSSGAIAVAKAMPVVGSQQYYELLLLRG